MKIAAVVCAWPPYVGGMANSAYQISQLLGEQHEVTNFTPTTLSPWLKKGHGAFLPQLLWRLNKFDYIYFHYPFFGTSEVIWLFKLLHKNKPKLIIHYHMDVKSQRLITKILSLPSLGLRHALLKQAEIIVTASLDYIKNSQIKKYYFAHPEKFQEIPFGLNLTKFKPKNLHQLAENKVIAYAQEIVHYINDKFIKKNRREFLFVGGLDQAHYFKGIDVLLHALAVVKSSDWRLTIIGDGSKRQEYEKLTQELQLTAKIRFVGKMSDADLLRSYQEADLLLLPSINNNEAFGLVLIEALACGVPVIASDLPGVRRVFNNWQEGLLVTPGSVNDLKNKLEFILDHEDLRQKMALAARQLAVRKYDKDKMKENLEKLFNE
ncbi:MAG: glycosyltransferase family 4 protein [Patescibacteria group bacterium]|jgi:glycosyltransferase involved in cell wall biosynthesis